MDSNGPIRGVKSVATGRVGVAAFTGLYLAMAVVAAIWSGNGEFVFYIAVMLALIGLIWQVDRRLGLPVAALWALSMWGLVHMAGGLVPAPASWPTNTEAGSGGVLYNLWFIPHKLKYDQVVHAYGFGVTAWIWWLGLSAILVGRLSELTSSGSKVGRLSELTSSESVVRRISEPTRSDFQREGDEEREGREAGNEAGRVSEPTGSGGIALRAVRSTVRSEGCAVPPLAPTVGPLFLCVCASMGLGAMNELVEFAATKLLPGTNVGGYDNTGWAGQ